MSKLEDLIARRHKIYMGGGEETIEKQHAKGSMTARERIAALIDRDSFNEAGTFVKHRSHILGMDKIETPGEGVVTGCGTINGRTVYLYAQDFTVMGGSVGEMVASKVIRVQELAIQSGAPLVGLLDSAGGRLNEGICSSSGYGKVFTNHVRASGIIPQLSAILGPCSGGACYSPALTDFVLTVKGKSKMFLTGPVTIKEVIHEEVDQETLGGAMIHNAVSGVAHFIDSTEVECFDRIRRILSYLPQNSMETTPRIDLGDDPCRVDAVLDTIVPENSRKSYDVKRVISILADNGEFFEYMPHYAKNMVTGYIRLDGRSVGVVANQTTHLAGCLDCNASVKAARFIRTCDCFNVPILSLADVPGFMPGTQQEHMGIIRHGAKMLYAFGSATVPLVSVIMRKSYGGAYNAMCDKSAGADLVFAWPTAEVAVMGADGAVNFVFKKELAKAEDRGAMKAAKIKEYEEAYSNPYYAASFGYVDDVIEPRYTRKRIINAFTSLEGKRVMRYPNKHGNIPL
jgi:acetyl-CoA carboxylase carboxyltransferase component